MLIFLVAIMVIMFSLINLGRIVMYMLGADLHDRRRHRAGKVKTKSHRLPSITVIVPAHDEEQVILRCLDSIFANKYRSLEVIVVDDGSTDATYSLVRKYKRRHDYDNLRLVHQANKGKASAINNGIKKAQSKLVMVLDSDSYLDQRALRQVANYFDDPAVVMTAANIKIIDDGSILGLVQKFEYLIAYRMKRAQSAFNIEYIIGGIGSTFRRDIAIEVGYYDTDTVTEDIDFTMKILRRGNVTQRVVYAPTVLAYTESVMTFGQLIRQRFRWKFGRFQTFIKNWQMFFNPDRRYDRRLTLFQLPFALYSEFMFIFEPLVLLYLIYIIVRFGDIYTLLTAYSVTTIYVGANIFAEDSETLRTRLKLLLLVPLQYPLFFILSAVEYVALVRSIVGLPRLIKGGGDVRWKHVSRAAKSVSF